MIETDKSERNHVIKKLRRRFFIWLFLNILYWGYIVYALATGCPFFFGDLNLVQQMLGFITIILAPVMPFTYYAILGLFLTIGLEGAFNDLDKL